MSVALLHPTGNRNLRAVLTALDQAGLLAEFGTTVAADPSARWLPLLPGGLRNEWLRRTFPVNPARVWTHPWREAARLILPRLGWQGIVRHEQGWACVDKVYQDLDRAAARRLRRTQSGRGVKAVYAYEDGAASLFTEATALGVSRVYDLPIAYWETGRRLMTEEAERLPAWTQTLGGGIGDSGAKLARKTRELEMADLVVCPSKFVADSLPAWARNKPIVLAPFGSPPPMAAEQAAKSEEQRAERQAASKPLRVLFAGSMGQRKGLGDLFAAIRMLKRSNVELVVMGSLLAPMEFYRKELPDFTHESGRPHDQVLALMRSCDVLCLPSIVEGRALVLQEAMSQGLPLLITPNTGGEDLIEEGRTGFLIPIRCPELLAEKIAWCADHGDAVREMGRAARMKASQYTWHRYGATVVAAIRKLISTN
jgi:glycosyltransferase involved in cell wall biosynthesis